MSRGARAGLVDVVDVVSDPALTWYLTRALGIVLLVVLTAATALGVLSTVSPAGGPVPRFASTDLHRRLSVIAMALLVGHVLVSVADSFVEITWLDALVPFVGSYRPLWLGLGTLATDVLLVVTATSLLRQRMGPRAWRGVHLSSYAAWPLMVVHGLGTGSDSRSAVVLVLTVACSLAVVASVAWRVATLPGLARGRRLAVVSALPVVCLVVAAWAVQGPLAPGWSRRAGTPPPPASSQGAAAPAPSAGTAR